MATYGIDYLRRLRLAVDEFELAFERWMATQVESDHMSSRGVFPTIWAKEGADPMRVRALELQVAEAAGVAGLAVAVTGAHIGVAGLGAIDPIANCLMMKNPKAVLSPMDVRATTASIKGRLAAMITDAEAESESRLPAFTPARLHPLIWSAAAGHWTTHQYRVAIREAAEGLAVHWKDRLSRHDVDDTVFWQQTLSPGEASQGKPKLVWPGDSSSKTVKSIRAGLEPLATSLKQLATGLNLTVRNVTTHTRDELSEQEAMERLSAYSFLARMLDLCEVQTATAEDAPPAKSSPLGEVT